MPTTAAVYASPPPSPEKQDSRVATKRFLRVNGCALLCVGNFAVFARWQDNGISGRSKGGTPWQFRPVVGHRHLHHCSHHQMFGLLVFYLVPWGLGECETTMDQVMSHISDKGFNRWVLAITPHFPQVWTSYSRVKQSLVHCGWVPSNKPLRSCNPFAT